MEDRHYENKLPAYRGEVLLGNDGKLLEDFKKPLVKGINKMLEKLYCGLDDDDEDDYSVYTGDGGIALLHLQLYKMMDGDKSHLERALDCVYGGGRVKGRRVSFLCGDAGPLAIAAVLYDKLGNKKECTDCVTRLEALHGRVCEDAALPDELLYGRVGYMYSLMYLQSHLGRDRVNNDILLKVYRRVIESGKKMAQEQNWKHPLMYAWHDKHYLGAAHGLAGIFYILMAVEDESVKQYIEGYVRPSIEYMLTLRFPSGNCPSSLGNSGDRLVHWCHGAPGWIYMFLQAYKMFKEERYLKAATECGECIWERGLLRKGHGLCHGIAGNAYAFLALYQTTNDQKYLHYTYQFAMYCIDNKPSRRADAPFSLFEGLAGTIYFLTDLLQPNAAKFPAFTV